MVVYIHFLFSDYFKLTKDANSGEVKTRDKSYTAKTTPISVLDIPLLLATVGKNG